MCKTIRDCFQKNSFLHLLITSKKRNQMHISCHILVINSPHSCLDSVTGDHYRLGEMWQQDDCTACTCRTGRKSQCRKSMCKKLTCAKTIHLKGRCCPACEEDAKSGMSFQTVQLFLILHVPLLNYVGT